MNRSGVHRKAQPVYSGFGPVSFGYVKKFNRVSHNQSLVEILGFLGL